MGEMMPGTNWLEVVYYAGEFCSICSSRAAGPSNSSAKGTAGQVAV